MVSLLSSTCRADWIYSVRVTYHGKEIEATKTNALFLNYPNDMMSGLFVDVDEENYLYIHGDSPTFDQMAVTAINEGIHQITMPENVDLTAYPHNCVVGSLARFTVQAAEEIAREACEG